MQWIKYSLSLFDWLHFHIFIQLIIFTPKSLLRLPEARSSFDEMITGTDFWYKLFKLCPAFSNNMWLYLIYLFCRDKILKDNSRWKSGIEKPQKSQKGHLLHWKSLLWAGKREKTASTGGGCCNCQIGAGCHYCFLIISIMALQKIALFTIKYILSS